MDNKLRRSKGWICNRSGNEYIHDFHLKKYPIIIKVASSIRIDNNRAKNRGSDSIRVFAVVKEALPITATVSGGLLKARRVNRTDNWRDNLEALVRGTIVLAKKRYNKYRK